MYESYQLGAVTTPAQEQSLRAAFMRKAVDLDEPVIEATGPKELLDEPHKLFFVESVITFGPKDEEPRTRQNVKIVPEPSVLLYVLNHIDELRAKHTAAIEEKQNRLAAQKALREEQRLASLEKQQQLQAEVEARNKKALA